MVTALLWWLLTGLITWLFNLKNIISLLKDGFIGVQFVFKLGYHAIMFIAHVVGGGISLAIFLYGKYRQWRGE